MQEEQVMILLVFYGRCQNYYFLNIKKEIISSARLLTFCELLDESK